MEKRFFFVQCFAFMEMYQYMYIYIYIYIIYIYIYYIQQENLDVIIIWMSCGYIYICFSHTTKQHIVGATFVFCHYMYIYYMSLYVYYISHMHT